MQRTCDCPVVFPESLALCGQVHRINCPFSPKTPERTENEMMLAMIARIDQILYGR
jgi:hypothetical protein